MFLQIKEIKHIKQDICSDAYAVPRDRAGGHWVCPGCQIFFYEHGHVAYKSDRDDENRLQVKFSPLGQTGDLGVGSKGQISLNFNYVSFKDFLTKLCVFSQIKDLKHIKHNFYSVA